jgi:hypothetical protein
MALLSTQQVTITGAAVTPVPAASGGDTVNPDERTELWVKNAHATLPRTVTIVRPGSTYGQANPDIPVVVPALGERFIGPLSRDLANTSGLIDVTYSDSAANLSVAVKRI